MKKFAFVWIFVAIVFLMVIFLTGCNKTPDNSTINNDTKEWISPDGVHYRYLGNYNSNGWTYVLAPRYDYEGNLVKEIHDPRN